MKIQSLLFAATAGFAAAGEFTRCGTTEPGDALRNDLNEAYYYSKMAEANNTDANTINVNVYVHLVTSKAKQSLYNVAIVQEQLQVMNDAFAPMGIAFTTKGMDFIVHDAWATDDRPFPLESQMKSALRRGSYADLNLYFLSDLPTGLLGFCSGPLKDPSAHDHLFDGCTCLADSMPGGIATDYNLGKTTVHEVGHWFGLHHVFDGQACSGPGDDVADTPAQSASTNGCPVGQDSCPGEPGVDSIHNYMDYSNDACRREFTHGQMKRARAIYPQMRAGK